MRKLIILICVVVLTLNQMIHSDDTKPDSNWATIVRNPTVSIKKPDVSLPAFSIDELKDSIIPDLTAGVLEFCTRCDSGAWRVDTIGYWNNYKVIDLYYEMQCRAWRDTTKIYSLIVFKAIAVEVLPRNYKLIYVSATGPGNIGFVPTKLIQVYGHAILFTRSQMSGTGRFFDETYWVWSEKFDSPRELQFARVNKEILSQILPPKHGIWKGGRFDIRTLSLHSHTWRDGDGNCCPSGGKLSISYVIKSDSIIVQWALFDYSDREVRALWKAGDSLYLKNPPNIYIGN